MNKRITPQEAVKILGGDFSDVTLKDGESHSDIFAEAFRMAIGALKKQVPKIPTYDGTIFTPSGDFVGDIWICPNCETTIERVYTPKHCPECGQAIDWSEEE